MEFRRRRLVPGSLLAIVVVQGSGPVTVSAQLGELPADAESVTEIMGERGELSFTFLAPPALIAQLVVGEYDFVTAREIAVSDSLLGDYLESSPQHGEWILTQFNVSAVDSMSEMTNGVPYPEVLASWIAPVTFAGRLPPPLTADVPVMYELSSWRNSSSDSVTMSLAQDPSGAWQLDLRAPEIRIHGWCQLSGSVLPPSYEAPGYVVMIGTDGRREEFTVVTFYGHEGQACRGNWMVSGSHPLAGALNGRPPVPGIWAQEMVLRGWRARLARYDRVPFVGNGG